MRYAAARPAPRRGAPPALPFGLNIQSSTSALSASLFSVWTVLAIASALIGATLWWSLRQSYNVILSYADAPTHLNLARHVHDDLHPGLGQLGDYWLPLAHVLELPFVWNDTLWHTGLAGTIPSIGCYFVSVWAIYSLAHIASQARAVATIAALAFAANPNVLYLHILPMFEPSLIASMLMATYFLARWLQSHSYGMLVAASAAVGVATTSRYEAWGFALASVVVIVVALMRRGFRDAKLRDHLLLYLLLAWYGMGLWLLWNLSLSGDPLYFLHPGFNKGLGEARLAILTKRNPFHATTYVFFSVADNAGPLLVGLAALGLWRFVLAFGVQGRALWLYLLAAPAAFDTFYLWFKGTPPILVPQLLPHISGNIRYGVVSLPFLCLCAAYLARRPVLPHRGPTSPPLLWRLARFLLLFWPLVQLGILAAVLIQPAMLVKRHYVVSYNEANSAKYRADQQARTAVAHWLHAHYDGGRILMSTFKGADRIILDSNLPSRIFIHEGSQNTWRCAIRRPQRWVRWIVLFKGGDGAAQLLQPTNRAVYQGEFFTRIPDAGGPYYWIYLRNSRPWQPAHPGLCE